MRLGPSEENLQGVGPCPKQGWALPLRIYTFALIDWEFNDCDSTIVFT